eukprot:Rmarinus@m.27073
MLPWDKKSRVADALKGPIHHTDGGMIKGGISAMPRMRPSSSPGLHVTRSQKGKKFTTQRRAEPLGLAPSVSICIGSRPLSGNKNRVEGTVGVSSGGAVLHSESHSESVIRSTRPPRPESALSEGSAPLPRSRQTLIAPDEGIPIGEDTARTPDGPSSVKERHTNMFSNDCLESHAPHDYQPTGDFHESSNHDDVNDAPQFVGSSDSLSLEHKAGGFTQPVADSGNWNRGDGGNSIGEERETVSVDGLPPDNGVPEDDDIFDDDGGDRDGFDHHWSATKDPFSEEENSAGATSDSTGGLYTSRHARASGGGRPRSALRRPRPGTAIGGSIRSHPLAPKQLPRPSSAMAGASQAARPQSAQPRRRERPVSAVSSNQPIEFGNIRIRSKSRVRQAGKKPFGAFSSMRPTSAPLGRYLGEVHDPRRNASLDEAAKRRASQNAAAFANSSAQSWTPCSVEDVAREHMMNKTLPPDPEVSAPPKVDAGEDVLKHRGSFLDRTRRLLREAKVMRPDGEVDLEDFLRRAENPERPFTDVSGYESPSRPNSASVHRHSRPLSGSSSVGSSANRIRITPVLKPAAAMKAGAGPGSDGDTDDVERKEGRGRSNAGVGVRVQDAEAEVADKDPGLHGIDFLMILNRVKASSRAEADQLLEVFGNIIDALDKYDPQEEDMEMAKVYRQKYAVCDTVIHELIRQINEKSKNQGSVLARVADQLRIMFKSLPDIITKKEDKIRELRHILLDKNTAYGRLREIALEHERISKDRLAEINRLHSDQIKHGQETIDLKVEVERHKNNLARIDDENHYIKTRVGRLERERHEYIEYSDQLYERMVYYYNICQNYKTHIEKLIEKARGLQEENEKLEEYLADQDDVYYGWDQKPGNKDADALLFEPPMLKPIDTIIPPTDQPAVKSDSGPRRDTLTDTSMDFDAAGMLTIRSELKRPPRASRISMLNMARMGVDFVARPTQHIGVQTLPFRQSAASPPPSPKGPRPQRGSLADAVPPLQPLRTRGATAVTSPLSSARTAHTKRTPRDESFLEHSVLSQEKSASVFDPVSGTVLEVSPSVLEQKKPVQYGGQSGFFLFVSDGGEVAAVSEGVVISALNDDTADQKPFQDSPRESAADSARSGSEGGASGSTSGGISPESVGEGTLGVPKPRQKKKSVSKSVFCPRCEKLICACDDPLEPKELVLSETESDDVSETATETEGSTTQFGTPTKSHLSSKRPHQGPGLSESLSTSTTASVRDSNKKSTKRSKHMTKGEPARSPSPKRKPKKKGKKKRPRNSHVLSEFSIPEFGGSVALDSPVGVSANVSSEGGTGSVCPAEDGDRPALSADAAALDRLLTALFSVEKKICTMEYSAGAEVPPPGPGPSPEENATSSADQSCADTSPSPRANEKVRIQGEILSRVESMLRRLQVRLDAVELRTGRITTAPASPPPATATSSTTALAIATDGAAKSGSAGQVSVVAGVTGVTANQISIAPVPPVGMGVTIVTPNTETGGVVVASSSTATTATATAGEPNAVEALRRPKPDDLPPERPIFPPPDMEGRMTLPTRFSMTYENLAQFYEPSASSHEKKKGDRSRPQSAMDHRDRSEGRNLSRPGSALGISKTPALSAKECMQALRSRKLRPLKWLSRMLLNIYDAKLHDDMKAAAEGRAFMALPLFINKFVVKKYGLPSLAVEAFWDIYAATEAYRLQGPEIHLFASFLEETLDSFHLNFFLRVRTMVEIGLTRKPGGTVFEWASFVSSAAVSLDPLTPETSISLDTAAEVAMFSMGALLSLPQREVFLASLRANGIPNGEQPPTYILVGRLLHLMTWEYRDAHKRFIALLRKYFDFEDKDKDGFLDIVEFANAVDPLRNPLHPVSKEVADVFEIDSYRAFDKKVLSFDSFVRMVLNTPKFTERFLQSASPPIPHVHATAMVIMLERHWRAFKAEFYEHLETIQGDVRSHATLKSLHDLERSLCENLAQKNVTEALWVYRRILQTLSSYQIDRLQGFEPLAALDFELGSVRKLISCRFDLKEPQEVELRRMLTQ